MATRFCRLAAVVACFFVCGVLVAEIPPLPKKQLQDNADVILSGKVTEVKTAQKSPPKYGDKETEYSLTVEVGQVAKGKLKEGARTVVARGSVYDYRPGAVGTGGHYSDNTDDRIGGVEKGWEMTLYLKAAPDGTYEIVFPNGFEVLKKPGKK
jgi:hypothetical protein